MTKYPMKETIKPDSYGNFLSDEAYEKQQKLLARYLLKYSKQIEESSKGA